MIRTGETRLRAYIDAAAALAGLPSWFYRGQTYPPGVLLEGLIWHESKGDPRARRYEPHQDRATRRDAAQDPDTSDRDDGLLEDDASYGLTQLMGYNARVLLGVPAGTKMQFGWLFLQQINISLGLRVLTGELRAVAVERPNESEAARVMRALARYNGGPTGDDMVDGDIRLRKYVDRVASACADVTKDRAAR